ncbi:MAG: PepSY domain-containing protein [Nitrospirota bacterium]|nr:MAG: PepSY domain-containing protein [Nitrospirota bacterium]
MTKRILVCVCLTLSAVTLNVGLGMSANQSGEMPAKVPVPKITMQEALKTATDIVPGRVVEAELEDEDDISFYEIEIISSDGMVVEVQVDANSGQIIKQAREGEVAYITVEEAIKSAEEFLRWHAVEVELEEEDGKAVYEIEMVNNLGDKQELEIDALSGKVLEPEPKKSEKD